jgi:hypothetical protein
MAIYRSDQTKVTFGTESAQGAMPEPIYGTAGKEYGIATSITEPSNPGDKKLTVASTTGITVGMSIIVGIAASAAGHLAVRTQQEIRVVEHKSTATGAGDIYLDRPLSFAHTDDEDLKEIDTYPTDYSGAAGVVPCLSWLPGVYDTVTLPEPSSAVDPAYFLGVNEKRQFTHAYRGQQSFDGSISSFALLNGWPLRYPFGSVNTTGYTSDAQHDGSGSSYEGTLETASPKGATILFITSAETTDLSSDGGDIIRIWNTVNSEVRQVIHKDTVPATGSSEGSSEAVDAVWLNYPLNFAYGVASGDVGGITQIFEQTSINDTTKVYKHTISTDSELDTISLQALFKDSADTDGNALIRKYYGGMVGSATIAAEEGGLVTMSWDSVPFMGMVHNIKAGWDSQGAAAVAQVAGYHLTGDPGTNGSLDYVGVPAVDTQGTNNYVTDSDTLIEENADMKVGFPQTEPYYFSQGEITLFDNVVARIRDFNLSINNNLEPRYYIEQRGDIRRRGPSAIHEARREYTISCTLVPDSFDTDGAATSDTDANIFREFLLQGDYGALGSNEGLSGFGLTLKFSRGTTDYIKLDIAASDIAGQPNAVITNAPVQIDGNNPLQIPVEILVRKFTTIEAVDTEPFYP